MSTLLLVSVGLIVAGAVGVLVLHASSALILSLGIAASVFAGNTKYMGIPIPPDRILIAVGLFLLLLGTERKHLPFGLRYRTQHTLMLILAAYATISSVVAGTFFGPGEAQYALLDRLSITAFVLFTVAPIVFYDRRTRNIFLGVMVGLALYLGVTALLEGIGLKSLALPSYIHDPNVGQQFERARGPMAESAGFGLALFECSVICAVAARSWTSRWGRVLAWIGSALCLVGVLFTLTRAVWIGVGLGLIAVSVVSREWRRRLLPAVALGAIALLVALSVSSSLSGQVNERTGEQRPVWDRLNLFDAGLRTVEHNPVFGVGYRNFIQVGDRYFGLLPDIPQTGTSIDIHNAVLSLAAELGLVGAIMWLAVVVTTIGCAIFWRPPPELAEWRLALVAAGVEWATVAMFTPFSYTFSFFFMWTLAGIVGGSHFTKPRVAAAITSASALPEAIDVVEVHPVQEDQHRART